MGRSHPSEMYVVKATECRPVASFTGAVDAPGSVCTIIKLSLEATEASVA